VLPSLRRTEGKTPLEKAHDDATRSAFCTAVTASVPLDVAALLSDIALSQFGPALCSQLGVGSLQAGRHVTEAHLASIGMKPVEACMFLNRVKLAAAAVGS
jgi:hypothetical protein